MTTPGPQRPPKASRGTRRPLLVWAATALVLFAAVTAAVIRTGPEPKTDFLASVQSQFQPAPPSSGETPAPESPRNAAALDAEIQRIVSENSGYRIGVALVDNDGGDPTVYGDATPFVAASTAKLITAAAYYHLVETGEKSLEVPLGSFDAAFQLKAMVNTSSDDSWLLLMQDIGYPRLIEYAASVGIHYDPEQNLMAPADMALLLRQLSSGTLLNAEHTVELLGYMQQTNNERLIPAAVDPAITVQHKYGEVEGYVHDAAILSSGGRSYSLVIYTWGEDGVESEERLGVIHELTKTVSEALFGRGRRPGTAAGRGNTPKWFRRRVAPAPMQEQDKGTGSHANNGRRKVAYEHLPCPLHARSPGASRLLGPRNTSQLMCRRRRSFGVGLKSRK